MKNLIIVGSAADNPFVEDISHHLRQHEDYSDIISLKSFLNTEFCPRFIVDESDWSKIGNKLEGKKILIASTAMGSFTRDELAMRNFLIARAAKDNGAKRVILLEPDLYYSAQDRGPRHEHGVCSIKRDIADYKKFDGQPFSARLYADLLKQSGVDEVVTIHNHSCSVEHIFKDRFSGYFHNLIPSSVYASYMMNSDIVNQDRLVLCSPDKGAFAFVNQVHSAIGRPNIPILKMDKERKGEREINIEVAADSEISLKDITGKEVIVLDDMVRTGRTIVECCKIIKMAKPKRIIFFVTHFNSSREGRINMNDPSIDEIVTSSTIPQILNRDVQGRLRHKMVVLRIERWISNFLLSMIQPSAPSLKEPFYAEDMSSKNPRWKGKMGPLFSSMQ